MFYKYPRTFHFPWSDGVTSDDKIISALKQFKNKRVIVTKKMDGQNTSLYRDHIHARSLDSAHHPSQDWIKQFWGSIRHDIPENWRICGEDLFAKHSIHYQNLKSYFYGFSIWNDDNIRLGWDETLEYFDLLNVQPVEVIYDGYFKETSIFMLMYSLNIEQEDEGFVMTTAEPLAYSDFSAYTVKYVRPNHVRTSSHWKHEAIVKNIIQSKP